MVYYNGKERFRCSTSLCYKELPLCNDDNAIDKASSILIVPEVFAYLLHKIRYAKKVIWWLSVYYYEQTFIWKSAKNRLKYRGLPSVLLPFEVLYKIIFHNEEYVPTYAREKGFNKIIHLYNCEYVRSYLINKHISESKMMYLCAPIDKNYFDKVDPSEKKLKITYNATKLSNVRFMDLFLVQLKNKLPGLEAVPIQNMKKEDVYMHLRESRLYIDFGFFPGPERLPRQAVAQYNNLLTSKIGSAGNDIDIPINDTFKFELINANLDNAVELARQLLIDYEAYIPFFQKYREKVYRQFTDFEKQIVALLQELLE